MFFVLLLVFFFVLSFMVLLLRMKNGSHGHVIRVGIKGFKSIASVQAGNIALPNGRK